jgi:hypothetical protein
LPQQCAFFGNKVTSLFFKAKLALRPVSGSQKLLDDFKGDSEFSFTLFVFAIVVKQFNE